MRVLNHPIQKFFEELNEMFITTSANLTNQPVIRTINDIPLDFKSHIDWIVD